MSTAPPPDVIVVATDESTAKRCSKWITDLPCCIVLDNGSAPSNAGIIKIGPQNSDELDGSDASGTDADVHLPADVSRRELHTVCRLMVEIARLRRSLHSSDRLGEGFKKAALTDPLTELSNRRDWQAALDRRMAQASKNHPLCLAVIDLDHFKQVNSSYGHAIGDQVLKQVATSIRCSLREDDFVARLGGDEFGLLLWAPSPQFAADIVERVRAAIGRLSLNEFFADETGRNITASAGFFMATDNNSPEASYSNADAAMHNAKSLGRDRCVAYEMIADKAE